MTAPWSKLGNQRWVRDCLYHSTVLQMIVPERLLVTQTALYSLDDLQQHFPTNKKRTGGTITDTRSDCFSHNGKWRLGLVFSQQTS